MVFLFVREKKPKRQFLLFWEGLSWGERALKRQTVRKKKGMQPPLDLQLCFYPLLLFSTTTQSFLTFWFSLWFSWLTLANFATMSWLAAPLSSSTVFSKAWLSFSSFNSRLDVNSFTSSPKDFWGAAKQQENMFKCFSGAKLCRSSSPLITN